MKGTKMLGVILLVCGILSLAYGGFTYTKKTNQVDLGPLSFEVKEKERVNVPLWVGIGLSVWGGAMLLVPSRSS